MPPPSSRPARLFRLQGIGIFFFQRFSVLLLRELRETKSFHRAGNYLQYSDEIRSRFFFQNKDGFFEVDAATWLEEELFEVVIAAVPLRAFLSNTVFRLWKLLLAIFNCPEKVDLKLMKTFKVRWLIIAPKYRAKQMWSKMTFCFQWWMASFKYVSDKWKKILLVVCQPIVFFCQRVYLFTYLIFNTSLIHKCNPKIKSHLLTTLMQRLTLHNWQVKGAYVKCRLDQK